MDETDRKRTEMNEVITLWRTMVRLQLVGRSGRDGVMVTPRGGLLLNRLLKDLRHRLTFVRLLGSGESEAMARLMLLISIVDAACKTNTLDELEALAHG